MQALRLDRLLTTVVFQPFQRAIPSARGVRLPILMYHSLSDNPEDGVSAYYKTHTRPETFRAHMKQLAAEGYKTLDLTRVVESLARSRLSEEKAVVITFDDGFKDFYTHAVPALQEHGFTAAMFLPTSYIGAAVKPFKGIECMTWNEVRELRKAGITFGSHTVTHPELVKMAWSDIRREVQDSKKEMEQQLGEPVTTFAYPYAFPQQNHAFAQAFENLMGESGYQCCVTTEIGRVKPGDNPFRLKRLPANSCDDPDLFRAKLEGGYDWLGVPQKAFKALKNSLKPEPVSS